MGDRSRLEKDKIQAICRNKNKKHPSDAHKSRKAGKE